MDWNKELGTKSFDELVLDARNRLLAGNSKITNWNVGGVFRTLTELAMQGLGELYKLLAKVVPQGFVQSASGVWLDYLVQDVTLERLPAMKTIGQVTFSRQDTGQAVRIPAGTILKTDMDDSGNQLRFFTTDEKVLAQGAASVMVPVMAEFTGAAYNVGEGYIRNVVTHIPGIDAITNAADWITREGSDEEADDSLRQRYYLKWAELGTGCPARAYVSWARSVAGVVDAACNDRFPRGPGTVDVVIASSAGVPTENLLSEVRTVIEAKRPNCADVLVKPVTGVPVPHEIVLYAYRNVGNDADMIAAAKAAVEKMFDRSADGGYLIGNDVLVNRYVARLMPLTNVVNVKILQPSTDIVVAADSIATLGTLTIRVERVDAS